MFFVHITRVLVDRNIVSFIRNVLSFYHYKLREEYLCFRFTNIIFFLQRFYIFILKCPDRVNLSYAKTKVSVYYSELEVLIFCQLIALRIYLAQ